MGNNSDISSEEEHVGAQPDDMPLLTLPSLITPALLSSIRRHPQLPYHSWYFITCVTLSALNRPDEIPKVFSHAIANGVGSIDSKPEHEEQLKIARKTREALIKAAPIGGLPKVGEFSTSFGYQEN